MEKSEKTIYYPARLVKAGLQGEVQKQEKAILQEHSLEIFVNEKMVSSLVCTASDLEELVVGRLVTGQIISKLSEVEQLYLCESGNRARVFLKETVKLVPASGEEPTCCTDNRELLQREKEQFAKLPRADWNADWIFKLVTAFSEDSGLHKSTGGTHSCILSVEGNILFQTEDIGRHNALDKAIGYAVRQQLPREKCILFTTGRVPLDMVKKVVAAGIPVLVSKSVTTAQAVEFARQYGLQLICRAWPDSFEVYTGDFTGESDC